MEITNVAVDKLIPYEFNNKKHDLTQVNRIANSIKEFGFTQPLVIDWDNVVIIWHGRLEAAKKLGLTEVPCVKMSDLSETQVKKLRILDNKLNESDWDIENLKLDLDDLEDFNFWDLELSVDDLFPDLFDDEEENKYGDWKKWALVETFLAPPLSIRDSKMGYWQDRKRQWKNLWIKSEVWRDWDILGWWLQALADRWGKDMDNAWVSIFDPVICELVYRWFNVEWGKIYDPFAWWSVRGIVASKLWYEYHGIDIRQEQVDANIQNAIDLWVSWANWYCDDSQNADAYIKDDTMDLVFSCPPYWDLEVYSELENDLSNMEYEDFKKAYNVIIKKARNKLKENRFAIFVVWDIRDKTGAYRNFVDYTKQCFVDNGLKFYNEIIYVEPIWTKMLRASKQFNNGRKVVKSHQNVLVFYKWDIKKIKWLYKDIDFSDIEDYGEEDL